MSTPPKPPHETVKPEPIAGVRLTESTRVEAFSDAVMAIVITLLVLELRVPPHEPGGLFAALKDMWPSVVGSKDPA